MAATLQIGRYEIVDILGSGASSRVAKARDSVIGRTVALKTFVQGFGEDCERQFLREAQIVGQLSHPSIVHLYDVGTDEHGTSHLVMEYVAGKTLEHTLAQGPIPFRKACAWGADLASALAAAHSAGIIHGDVKPSNIFITDDGKVKLGDFGIARLANHHSGSGRVMGTPAYLSPEQINAEKQDCRSDLFSLGVVLYEMALGSRPFDGSSLPAVCSQILNVAHIRPSHRNPALPVVFDKIIARCLAKNPAERFENGDELARALYPLARESKSAPAPRPLPWLARPFGKNDLGIAAVIFLALTCSATISHSVYERLHMPSAPTLLSQVPQFPSDLYGYSRTGYSQPSILSPEPDVTADDSALTDPPNAALKRVPASKHTVRDTGRPKVKTPIAVSAENALPPLPVLPASLPNAPLNTPPTNPDYAELQIEIASTIDGTLAIFADQKLIATTELHNDSANAVRIERDLSTGTHQFRVALYRPDKSLQTEKEGLSELRGDKSNSLGIRINRRSKLSLHREPSIEIVWPSAQPRGQSRAVRKQVPPPLSSAVLK
jgi:serine/threonine-protein kinase